MINALLPSFSSLKANYAECIWMQPRISRIPQTPHNRKKVHLELLLKSHTLGRSIMRTHRTWGTWWACGYTKILDSLECERDLEVLITWSPRLLTFSSSETFRWANQSLTETKSCNVCSLNLNLILRHLSQLDESISFCKWALQNWQMLRTTHFFITSSAALHGTRRSLMSFFLWFSFPWQQLFLQLMDLSITLCICILDMW